MTEINEQKVLSFVVKMILVLHFLDEQNSGQYLIDIIGHGQWTIEIGFELIVQKNNWLD